MGSQEEFRRRKRQRKTKSERDKTRTSVPSQGEVDVKQDVSRHLKTARHVSYPLRSLGGLASDKSSSIISQSRLTRRLGLYNQSKTSRKICREPIIVPESVRKKTEEDLKKILDLTEKMPALQMEVDMDVSSPTLSVVEKNKPTSKSSATAVHDVPSSGISLPSTSHEVTPVGPSGSNSNTKHSVKAAASACASLTDMDEDVNDEDDFPSSPPMNEIAEYLCGELENQTMFRDRDLVQEICDELIKNFRIIGPRCATPSSKQNEKSVAAGSIRRVLLDSYSDSPNKENTDLMPTAEIIISQNLSTSEARCSVQIHGDQKSTYFRESKSESAKNHFCRSLAFNESCRNILETVHLKEKDIRQECADALILLGKTHQAIRDNGGTVEMMCKSGKEVDSNVKNVMTLNNPHRNVTESQSSPSALALLVQNDKNEASLLAKQAECGSSHISKDPFLLYHRNYKMTEKDLYGRETTLPLPDRASYYNNKNKAHTSCIDMSRLYDGSCSQHLKEQIIPGSYSQASGFYRHYPQMSTNTCTVSSLDQLLKCDRPLERCLCSDEHSFVVPTIHKNVHKPLESHRQNLALAIQSAARPWTKETSLPERKKTAVVTEYQQHPEFMPRFHGDFYKDALLFQDDVWPNGDKTSDHSLITETEMTENMDILDYLDHSQGSQGDRVHDGLHRHGKITYNRKLLRPGSPDSDGSPTWIAPEASLRAWKPKIGSPESPQKLYPRRLY
ncbi:uncharacterized protein LOC121380984 [Gigantopelta aegis]|uniref:uncharacterized protein LOC121380984 n=1 Tax=Gigantopelta aegis TaxID=1735272 RepID=UPI001B88AE46|nr:uncharacterized protein LOC121380984 [Gigantopelta aegis]